MNIDYKEKKLENTIDSRDEEIEYLILLKKHAQAGGA